MNDLIKYIDEYKNEMNICATPLNRDKEIHLIRIFEQDFQAKKKYLRNILILVQDTLLTSTFVDTVHFFEEIALFDVGNDQNKYLDITEYKSTKNLKLKLDGHDIFISKSETKALYKIYNMAFSGYSLAHILEDEYKLSIEKLLPLLHKNGYFQR